MRLLTRVGRLAAARRGAVVAGEPIGLVWTQNERRLPEGTEFGPGEHLATDYYEVAGAEPGAELPPERRSVERITRDPADLGRLYNAEGVQEGRVVSVSKSGVYRVVMEPAGGVGLPQDFHASGGTKL